MANLDITPDHICLSAKGVPCKTSSSIKDMVSETTLMFIASPSLLPTQVMTHELCHTFGMKHCYYFECAMNESSSIEQAARQPLFLCPVCLRKLHKALRFNILERFRMLAIQCQKLNQVVKDCSESIIRQRCEEDPQQGLEVEADGAVSMAGGDVTEHLQYFRQATEWLENSIASLSQFAE